jgi:hypothetical protein
MFKRSGWSAAARTRSAEAAAGARFLLSLPGFLQKRLEPAEAAAIVCRRLARREQALLDLLRFSIFGNPHSPYRRLLRHAGCELGDVEQLVRKEGLEEALRHLLKSGVYFLVDEYKGRKPVRRGSLAFQTNPAAFRSPGLRPHITARSSGSRGPRTPAFIDLRFISDCAVNCLLMLRARGGESWVKADWEVPGGGALFRLLKFSRFGAPPARWFSQFDPASPGLGARYRWSASTAFWGSRLSHRPLPRLEIVPLHDPLPIARWIESEVAGGNTPCLFTFPSSAVRLCCSAEKAGIGLGGARILISGEPITEARLRVIRRSGAEPIPRFGTIECGPIGYGCMNPEAADDMHLNHDMHGLIQAGDQGAGIGVPGEALFLTTLLPTHPFVFLNVSMGDQAFLGGRACGCPLEEAGWTRHACRVRSFEKLTCAGMTFLDTDIIRVLEEVLPAKFGGSATDYQLVEEEDREGTPVLTLLIRPDVGPVGEAEAARAFTAALSRGEGPEKVMAMAWEEAAVLRIERRAPIPTSSGKILHLFLKKPISSGTDGVTPG